MLPPRPYLIRAMYEWLTDSGLTTYILVDARDPTVLVPSQYINPEGHIVLNIQAQAVARMHMDNVALSFDARFSGVSHTLYIPMQSIKAIYAYEEGTRSLVFDEEMNRLLPPASILPAASGSVTPRVKGRPALKVVSCAPPPDKAE